MVKYSFLFITLFLTSFCSFAQGKSEVEFQAHSLDGYTTEVSVIFPNPSIQGQDIFIAFGSTLPSDWWVVVYDSNGRDVKGISAVQEGGRIRIHGQTPKPGIYTVNFGYGSFRSTYRWIVR